MSGRRHLHVVGTRPNFVKAAPVIQALRESGADPMLVHTGQHFDPELSAVFFDELGLPEPDHQLGIGSGSHAAQTAELLVALERLMSTLSVGRVIVYGDVNSTLAAALAASKLGIPVAHVEAGLRSFDRSMPEEINRVVTDAVADLHFVTSPEAMGHLAREGVGASAMHFVGNPMIDTLIRFKQSFDPDRIKQRLGVGDDYAVVTLHRPANVDEDGASEEILDGLRRVSQHMEVVVPLHPRGRARLLRGGLDSFARVVEPLGYLDFMSLMSAARVVITDSGGIQEETTYLHIPCLTLRDNTERPITLTMGTNRLVGRDPALIEAGVLDIDSEPFAEVPPLWDGRAGLRIARTLSATG